MFNLSEGGVLEARDRLGFLCQIVSLVVNAKKMF